MTQTPADAARERLEEKLAARYVEAVGYNPFVEDCASTVYSVARILREYKTEKTSWHYMESLKAPY